MPYFRTMDCSGFVNRLASTASPVRLMARVYPKARRIHGVGLSKVKLRNKERAHALHAANVAKAKAKAR